MYIYQLSIWIKRKSIMTLMNILTYQCIIIMYYNVYLHKIRMSNIKNFYNAYKQWVWAWLCRIKTILKTMVLRIVELVLCIWVNIGEFYRHKYYMTITPPLLSAFHLITFYPTEKCLLFIVLQIVIIYNIA